MSWGAAVRPTISSIAISHTHAQLKKHPKNTVHYEDHETAVESIEKSSQPKRPSTSTSPRMLPSTNKLQPGFVQLVMSDHQV